jgi:hypothetical protein
MTEQERDKRNLNPSKEARAAMWLWSKEYSKQAGGSMDFYDKLDPSRKRLCTQMVDDILAASWREAKA